MVLKTMVSLTDPRRFLLPFVVSSSAIFYASLGFEIPLFYSFFFFERDSRYPENYSMFQSDSDTPWFLFCFPPGPCSLLRIRDTPFVGSVNVHVDVYVVAEPEGYHYELSIK